jgi:hypothetical protein
MIAKANDPQPQPEPEEAPAEITLEETGSIVEEPEPETFRAEPEPEPSPAEPAPSFIHGGQVVESVWDRHPNFTCSRCGFASLNRADVEAHINTPIDH